ncbi:ParB N-terminal domain-containing protein [Roseicyclus sp.]|uniref:ParB N-terminal domain-containing protein n=1 Tax=Roseicyclus sp. TaxID=1914329 RepID=UPI003F6CB430
MTLRKIETANMTAPAALSDPGPAPRVEMVPLDRLVIDETYQRPLTQRGVKVVQNIAARFQWSRFQPVMAAPLEDGRFAIIDGQHRAHAARLIGIDAVPCAIVAIPRWDQAGAFSEINTNRTNVSPHQVFKAALAAGEGWAMDADRAVSKAGCRLMTYVVSAAMRKPRQIYAVVMIRNFAPIRRGALITSALSAITGSAHADDLRFYREDFLRCWFHLLRDKPELLYRDLAACVSALNLDDLAERAEALRATPEWARRPARARLDCVLRVAMLSGAPATLKPKAPPLVAPAQIKARVAALPAPPCAASPPHPDWPVERDAALIETGGKYDKISELAEKWQMPISKVQARWHKVRAA